MATALLAKKKKLLGRNYIKLQRNAFKDMGLRKPQLTKWQQW